MDNEKQAVARVRAAEVALNDAIRDLPRGIVVEVDSISHSTMLDASAQQFVALRIIKEF